MPTDDTGRYAVLYRTLHFIGLELGPSVASVALRGEPRGVPSAFVGDVAAVARRNLRAGDVLDGEGGYTVRGEALPASRSLRDGALPIGLASGMAITRDSHAGDRVSCPDVELDDRDGIAATRRELRARSENEHRLGGVLGW